LRFLYEYIQILGLDYDSKRINEIYESIENNITQRNGSTISLTASQWLYADEKIVETIPHKKVIEQEKFQPLNISGEGEYEFANKTFTIKKYEEGQLFVFPDSTSNFAYVDLSGIAMPITIRTRKEGDIITPFGMKGSMKLKKYMNAKGISRHKRDEIILLCKDDEILWVSSVGLNDKIGVKVKPTHVIEVK
jgi:tRNA(Ile)-lysidine synthase